MLYWITGLWGQLHFPAGEVTLQGDDAFSRNLRGHSLAATPALPGFRKDSSGCVKDAQGAALRSHSEVRRYTIQ